MALDETLLELLACPECKAPVALKHDTWLVCSECDRKYPIVNEIPVMLIEDGSKYRETRVEDLPDPSAL